MNDQITVDPTLRRLTERQCNLRAGGLTEVAQYDAYPPCSRHDDVADDQAERVKLTWAYAMGLMRDVACAAAASAMIVRMHDHKGELYVVCLRPLPGKMCSALRRAWTELGSEDAEAVHFELPSSPIWNSVWQSRRFNSTAFASASTSIPSTTADELPLDQAGWPFDENEEIGF